MVDSIKQKRNNFMSIIHEPCIILCLDTDPCSVLQYFVSSGKISRLTLKITDAFNTVDICNDQNCFDDVITGAALMFDVHVILLLILT